MPTVQIYIRKQLWIKIQDDARKAGVTEMSIIREILEDHYAKKGVYPERKTLRAGIRE
jgi:hypothetical protein